MASNTQLNTGTGGDVITTKERTHDGDATKTQVVNIAGVTGTEGSYTHVDVAAGGGAEASALRVTIANDSTGVVSVDDNGGSLTVDGTVTAAGGAAHDAAVSGNPVLQAGYASAAAPSDVSGDGDAVRSWHLRNGAQATVITAGGALIGGDATNGLDTDVTRVIPGTSATHLGKAVDSAAGATDTGVAMLAVRDDTLSTLTPADGDYTHLRVDSTGALHVRISGGGVSGVVDDAAFTAGTTELVPQGMVADESSTDSVDEGDLGAPRITLDRKQIITNYVHAAAGGATPYKNLDVDESEDDIKTSAGKLYWLHVINLANAVRYLKIYNNVAASVTVGTTVPDLTFPIPTMGDTNGAGFTINFGPQGLQFTTGICIAATTGLADNNSGAPGAGEVVLNAGYA